MKQETVRYWLRIIVGNLIASAVVLFAFSGVTMRTPGRDMVHAYLIALLFSTCIAPLVGVAMPRIAPIIWGHVPFPFNWIVVTVAMAVMAIAGSAVAIVVLVAVGYVPPDKYGEWFQGSLRIAIVLTLTIGLFITAYEVMRARVAQADTAAQLQSLESRVQPHFLFNTLNSIAALIHEDPQGAERMTNQLASLLRSSLDQQATPLVAIEDELKIVRDYLSIEQVRFGDRLRCTIDADPALNGHRVPRLALQTLVENSVKYAVTPRREGAALTIRAADERDGIRLTVEDDGPGFDGTALPPGHGLALLQDRLALLFGSEKGNRLQIDSSARGTRVTLLVPHLHDKPATVVRRKQFP